MFQLRNIFASKPKEPIVPVFTQDWERLQDAAGWTFFEYGEFKRGMSMHQHLNLPVRCHALTAHKCPLWLFNDHQDVFPIAIHHMSENNPVRRASIMGEVFQVPTDVIPHIDNYRQNGVQFVRRRVTIRLPSLDYIRAFCYIGVKEYWMPKIQFFDNFTKGREASAFSLIKPKPIRNTTNWYSAFTKEDLVHRPTRCFIGLNTNGRTPDQQQAA